MNIPVDYIDPIGVRQHLVVPITRLSFIKHMAFAGMGFAPRPSKLFRALGMFLHYSYYLQRRDFYANRFSQPPILLSDPTEKSQFSNIAGRAIGDILAKRINNAYMTVTYEAEMKARRIRYRGVRPDLYAYSRGAHFAIEAKGYTNGPGNMADHKAQAASGPLPKNFSVASVAYHIYQDIQCNYHDPVDGWDSLSERHLNQASREYYTGLAEFLNRDYFEHREVEYKGEIFYEVEVRDRLWRKLIEDQFNYMPRTMILHELDIHYPKLILPKSVNDLAKNGINLDMKPFEFIQGDGIYIDNDRVGLKTGGLQLY